MNIKKYFGSRKFRYGSVAVAFSIVFVIFVLILNIALTVIGQKYDLYMDMTKEELYTVSEASREQLKNIKTPVEIIFFQKKEDIPDPEEQTSALGYVKYLAEEYKKSFDFIDVKYVDMLQSPAAANAYKTSANDTIRTDSVVINCPSNGKKKIVQVKGFFTFNESGEVYGFNGEKRITSCILQVTNPKKSKVYFTNGHGEYLSGTIATLLDEQGYEVNVIDLSTQDIPADADIIIINQPTKDFAGIAAETAGSANEIEKIKNFVQKDYGDVILAIPGFRYDGTSTPDFPELRALMEDNFGITYTPVTVMQDTAGNAVDTDGMVLVSQGAGETNSFEYQMHKAVTEKGIKILAPYSLPLKIIGNTDKYTAPVLVSSGSSIATKINDDGSTETLNVPNSPLVAISTKAAYDDNGNEEKRGTLLVAGSLILEYAASDAYGNRDFLYGILKSFGNTTITMDIPVKPFNDTFLDVTPKDGQTMALILTLVIPIIILIFGMLIWYRRKRR